jgi:hypothetical protein
MNVIVTIWTLYVCATICSDTVHEDNVMVMLGKGRYDQDVYAHSEVR